MAPSTELSVDLEYIQFAREQAQARWARVRAEIEGISDGDSSDSLLTHVGWDEDATESAMEDLEVKLFERIRHIRTGACFWFLYTDESMRNLETKIEWWKGGIASTWALFCQVSKPIRAPEIRCHCEFCLPR